MIRLSLLLLLISGIVLPSSSAQLAPGDTPQLTLRDGLGNDAPPAGGPYDSSGVFSGSSGLFFSADLAYLAENQNNFDVPWGLLVSSAQTPFPTNLLPPPLFVQPPFVFVVPTPAMLDGSGFGTQPMSIPNGLYSGDFYVQAIVQDVSSFPALKLSNGVRVNVTPPEFNVRFSFVRSAPALGILDIEGVGHRDIDGDTLNTFAPFASGVAPLSDVDAVGLPVGMRFLPILSNSPDAPINPLSQPVTTITASITTSPTENTFQVADTTGFPDRGSLLVAFQGKHPWSAAALSSGAPPKAEVVSYRGKTATSFLNVKRRRLGSSGNQPNNGFTHTPGDFVVGEFSIVTTSGALSRSRVSLDARNPELVHVVIPQFSYQPAEEGTAVTLDLDLYLYEDQTTKVQGFCLLDRASHTWRVIPGTEVDASSGDREWNPMVSIAPDGRSMIAAVKVNSGDFAVSPSFVDGSDPDELWAIRLDGELWPVSGQETWQVDYQVQADPSATDTDVRSRLISMPSVAIVGDDSQNLVAFVGLAHKFAQSDQGTNLSPQGALTGPFNGFESRWIRREVWVRDYIDVPLADPSAIAQTPVIPRPYINGNFGTTGTGLNVKRFDPTPIVSADGRAVAMAAGPEERDEDMFYIDNITHSPTGEPVMSIRNLSGHGGGAGADEGAMRLFYPGGQGRGNKAAMSPGGTYVAWAFQEAGFDNRDWLHIAPTNGTGFATVDGVFRADTGKFKIPGDFVGNRVLSGLHFVDEDRIVFLMGLNPYADPMGFVNSTKIPLYDVFLYTISTDVMVNLTNTAQSASGLDTHGTLIPAGQFLSPNRQFLYIVRDGEPIQGNTILAPGVEVMNILGIDLVNGGSFDVSGDELSVLGSLPNLDLPGGEALTPVETLSTMGFVEGSGVQGTMMFFTSHMAGDLTETDELFGFDMNAPFLGVSITGESGAGTHISNVTPDPFGSRVAFAQTADSDPLGNTQHAFVSDLATFSFIRDLTPALVLNGNIIGRVMDGSFHFLPPSNTQVPVDWDAEGALVFSIGNKVDPVTGVATQTAPVYYPLANLANTLLEPVPVLLPLLSTQELGPNYRIYLPSAGLSTGDP